jgi:LysM repeat protein
MISVQNPLQQLSGSKLLLVLTFLLFGLLGNAQEPEVTHFIIHKVKKKETLERIAMRYDITPDQIVIYNPTAKAGIRKRDKLKIPRYKTKVVVAPAQPKTATHSVQPKETLWRIAYNYGISVDSLRVLNPQLGDTLSVGSMLTVPSKIAEEIAAQFDYYTVQPKEGFFRLNEKLGLSKSDLEALNPSLEATGLMVGMVLKIPKVQAVDSSAVGEFEPIKTSLWDSTFVTPVVRIAFLAPFRLSRIELDSIDQTNKTLSERNLTTVSLDFYSGMLHAVDSLNKAGLSIELSVFDSEGQLHIIEQLLNQEDFTAYDAVIGPFTPANVSRMAQAMSFFNVPVISPLTTREIQPRKMLINTIPSKKSLAKRMMSYVDSLDAQYENPCVLIIADSKNKQTALRLKEQFPLAEVLPPDEKFGFIKPDLVDSLLTPTRPNWVFLETENLNLVTSMTSMLNAQSSEARQVQLLTHFRSPAYDDKNISQAHLGNIHFSYPNHFLEKRDSLRLKFDASFKDRYGKVPSRTAVKGFDVMVDASLRIATKRKLIDGLTLGVLDQLQYRFDYQPNPKGGYRNTATYLVQHQGFETIEITPMKPLADSLHVR